eukprot:gene6256-8463_t
MRRPTIAAMLAGLMTLWSLGGAGFALDGDVKLDETIAGVRIQRAASLAGGVVTVEDRVQETGAEIAPADIVSERARLAAAQRRLLRVSSAVGYPAPWVAIVAAKRAHQFDQVLALYAAKIADKPDEAGPYLARASFLIGTFERRAALADLDRAIAIAATADTYLRQARACRRRSHPVLRHGSHRVIVRHIGGQGRGAGILFRSRLFELGVDIAPRDVGLTLLLGEDRVGRATP